MKIAIVTEGEQAYEAIFLIVRLFRNATLHSFAYHHKRREKEVDEKTKATDVSQLFLPVFSFSFLSLTKEETGNRILSGKGSLLKRIED